jgi:hypothetical protein
MLFSVSAACNRGWSQFCSAKLLLAHASWVAAAGGDKDAYMRFAPMQ